MHHAVSVHRCPHCSGPLTPPSKFARSMTCPFCSSTVNLDPSVVSVARFREALANAKDPEAHGGEHVTFAAASWALSSQLARGEIADVYLSVRRGPAAQTALLKILRDQADAPLVHNEIERLELLRHSELVAALGDRLPSLLAHGRIFGGKHDGRFAVAFKWAQGYLHSLEAVRRAYPDGIDPVISIWIWRRLLEALSAIHRTGLSHGSVLPHHALIQKGEHGLRLIGFGCTDAPGGPLRALSGRYEAFYPDSMKIDHRVSPDADLRMSARCIAYLLGADATSLRPGARVPSRLSELVNEVAFGASTPPDAWLLREQVGQVGREVFGPPAFHPLAMPS